MAFTKVVGIIFAIAACSFVEGSVLGPAIAPLAYTQFAPPNIPPYAASVNTFTRGLNVYAAPYAAGVLPGPPAVIPRGVLRAPAFAPAPLLPAPIVGPAPLLAAPYAAPAPLLPRSYVVSPPLLPAPVALGARSVHAVAPAFGPAFGPAIAPAIAPGVGPFLPNPYLG